MVDELFGSILVSNNLVRNGKWNRPRIYLLQSNSTMFNLIRKERRGNRVVWKGSCHRPKIYNSTSIEGIYFCKIEGISKGNLVLPKGHLIRSKLLILPYLNRVGLKPTAKILRSHSMVHKGHINQPDILISLWKSQHSFGETGQIGITATLPSTGLITGPLSEVGLRQIYSWSHHPSQGSRRPPVSEDSDDWLSPLRIS